MPPKFVMLTFLEFVDKDPKKKKSDKIAIVKKFLILFLDIYIKIIIINFY